MQIGFIGLGAVVETAYLPALRRLGTSSTAAVAMTWTAAERCRGSTL